MISPLLANLYLHYTLDLWFTRRFAKTCTGTARLIRYADDFVACFQIEADAIRYRKEMEERLNQFGLEVAPDKTKMIEFGPLAARWAKERGIKPASFDFLGFTHYGSRSRSGRRFRMKRQTISKRFGAKLQGHYGYYGVTDNARKIGAYCYEVRGILFKWLNRRGKRGSYTWEKFGQLLARYPLPEPRIMVSMF